MLIHANKEMWLSQKIYNLDIYIKISYLYNNAKYKVSGHVNMSIAVNTMHMV